MSTTLKFHITPDVSVSRLKAAIERQIEVMEADAKLDKFSDPIKAKRYQDKLRKILTLNYFTTADWLKKRVRTLNADLKEVTRTLKDQKTMVDGLLEEAKNLKLKGVQMSIADLGIDGEVPREKVNDIDERYKHVDEEISRLEVRLNEKEREYRELRFLQGLINNPEFFSTLYRQD